MISDQQLATYHFIAFLRITAVPGFLDSFSVPIVSEIESIGGGRVGGW